MSSRRSYGGGSKLSCPNHPNAHLVEDHRAGDMVCPECGLVVGDRVVDVGSEWRTFSNESNGQDRSRVGGNENPFLSGQDLSTMVGTDRASGSGLDLQNYARYQNRSGISGSDRSLLNAIREIGTMASRINLPKNITDRANLLFKQVHDQRSLRGRSNDAIASACLYIACRQDGVPRTFKEICAISKIPKKEIGRCFKLILKNLEANVSVITSGDFMDRFCSTLSLATPVIRASKHIAKKAVDLDLVPGRSPISVAAAAIYLASQASEDKKSQKDIGDIAGVAEVTIRQSYRSLIGRAAELFPPDFVFHTPIEKLPTS
ncbi:transcription initiation factor IIB-like [Clytia hemisphaerica]|uniref:Transcription initiation factor IIB n=1 Tax=Clytia hemisphaerica TaxID=252671 RepID=A0A7M6DPA5_9CNID